MFSLNVSIFDLKEFVMCIKNFEEIGRVINGQAGEGILIGLEDFEELEYSCEIVNLFHEKLGRYIAEDIDGNVGYFYPMDVA